MECFNMESSKSFLKIFLGLAMVFVFSFNVFAKNRHEEKVGQKFEDFAIKIGLHTEEKRRLLSGKSILKSYIEKGLKLKGGLREEKFKKTKEELLVFCRKRIEGARLTLKKQQDLLKKIETNLNEENFKNIIKFGIEEFKKDVSFLNKCLKTKGISEEEKDSLNQGIDLKKKCLEYLNKLNNKNKLCDADRKGLKRNLKLGIDEAKNDLKETKKIKEEIESLEYKEFRKYISKGETKNKDLEKFIKNFNVKNKGSKEKAVSDMVLQYIFEKNNLKKGFKITKNMFEEAKKEFIEFYKKIIEEKEGLAKKGEEAFKKGFMAVINVKIKEDEKEMELVEETSKEKGLKKWQEDDLKKAKQRLMGSLSWLKKIKNKEIEIDENEKIKIKDDLRAKIIQSTIVAQSIKDIKKEFEKLKYEEVKNLAD